MGQRKVVQILCALSFSVMGVPAIATEPAVEKPRQPSRHEVRLGVLAHDVDDLWSGVRKEGGVDLNAEIIFGRPSLSLVFGSVRPNVGASINTQGDTSKIYGGMLWELETKLRLFVDLGVGIAVHDGELESDDKDEKSLGSRVLGRVTIEVGYTISERDRISVVFDHISNAYLAEPNEGLDTVGLRYGYRF